MIDYAFPKFTRNGTKKKANLLVCVDAISGYMMAAFVQRATSECAEKVLTSWIAIRGVPSVIRADRAFSPLSNFCNSWEISLELSARHAPWTNVVERFNGIIKPLLIRFTDANLARALIVANNCRSSATGIEPSKVIFNKLLSTSGRDLLEFSPIEQEIIKRRLENNQKLREIDKRPPRRFKLDDVVKFMNQNGSVKIGRVVEIRRSPMSAYVKVENASNKTYALHINECEVLPPSFPCSVKTTKTHA